MGLLDDVLGGMMGSPTPGTGRSGSPLTDILGELLGQGNRGSAGGGLDRHGGGLSRSSPHPGGGGLGGLLDSFTRSGHGDITDSWVSAGPNRQVAPQQLEEAMGRDRIDELAQRAGMSREELLRQLSAHLPNAVDKLTPQGRRPTAEDMNHW